MLFAHFRSIKIEALAQGFSLIQFLKIPRYDAIPELKRGRTGLKRGRKPLIYRITINPGADNRWPGYGIDMDCSWIAGFGIYLSSEFYFLQEKQQKIRKRGQAYQSRKSVPKAPGVDFRDFLTMPCIHYAYFLTENIREHIF